MFPLLGTERARQDIAETFTQFNLSENMMKMVATRVLPLRTVREAHGTYPVIPIKQLMKRPSSAGTAPTGFALRRAPGAVYRRDDLGFTQASYTTEEHGLEGVVDENNASHYASHFDHEVATTDYILNQLMTERELRTASSLFNTTRFTPGASGQSQDAGTYREDHSLGAAVPWSDHANATPIRDFFVARDKIWTTFGVYPDCAVMNEESFQNLRRVDEIRQQWMALGAGSRATQGDMTLQALQQILNIDEIIVASGVMDANNAGTAAFQASHIWGNGCLVFKKTRGTDIREVALGHTFHFQADGSIDPALVEDYYEVQSRTQVIRVRHQDRQLVKYDIGEFITNTL